MPKCKAKVLISKIIDGQMLAKIQLNGKMPKKGDVLSVKWGAVRSMPQNALYWVYLSWLIEHGGLKDHGHFSPQAFHDNLKQHFLSTKAMTKGEFKSIESADALTTTQMNKSEFSEYVDKVDKFVQSFFEIDTSAFWDEHKQRSL